MKALLLALTLALTAQTPATRPVAPASPAAKAPAAPAKPAPAKPAPPPPSTTSPAEALAECRASCTQSHLFCLQQEDSDTCNPSWLLCRAKCARANPD
jgi:hypothetical protein